MHQAHLRKATLEHTIQPGLPTQLVKVTLDTKSDDCIALDTSEAKEDETFRIAEMRKKEKLEDSGCGDELQELQQVLWPVDWLCQNYQQGKFFRVDTLFEQTYQETKEVFRFWSQVEVIDVKRVNV